MTKILQSTYVGDDAWDRLQKSIRAGKTPFKYIDRLEIGFATVNTTDPDNSRLEYVINEWPQPTRVTMTRDQAKYQNRDIEVIAQMDHAWRLAPLVADPRKAETRLDTFAASIPKLLKQYNLQGIDFDWEFSGGGGVGKMTTDLASFLFTQTRYYLNSDKDLNKPIMTITRDAEYPLKEAMDFDVLNKVFDGIIVQSYGRVYYIDNYLNNGHGVKPSLLYVGLCSEPGEFFPDDADISPYTKKVRENNLPGLYAWRVDNDDPDLAHQVPKYTITTKLTHYSRGHPPDPPLYP
jgi:GH18 family chitinase